MHDGIGIATIRQKKPGAQRVTHSRHLPPVSSDRDARQISRCDVRFRHARPQI